MLGIAETMSAISKFREFRTYGLHHSWGVIVSIARLLFILLQSSSAQGITIPFENLQVADFLHKCSNQCRCLGRTLNCHIHPWCMSDIRTLDCLTETSCTHIWNSDPEVIGVMVRALKVRCAVLTDL